MKKEVMNIAGVEFNVKVEYIGTKVPTWDKKGHYTYNVCLSTNGKSYSTTFYDSLYNTENNEKGDIDIKSAVHCIFMDAMAFLTTENYDRFCIEFYGGEKSNEALKAFKGCKRAFDGLSILGITKDNIYNIINALGEEDY